MKRKLEPDAPYLRETTVGGVHPQASKALETGGSIMENFQMETSDVIEDLEELESYLKEMIQTSGYGRESQKISAIIVAAQIVLLKMIALDNGEGY